jgi:transposase
MVEEAEQPGSSVSQVARKNGVTPSQIFHWRMLMRAGGLSAIRAEETVVPASEVKQLKGRIRDLERLLGKKTMEVEILKEAIEIAREKKLLLRMPSSDKGGSGCNELLRPWASPGPACTRSGRVGGIILWRRMRGCSP